MKGITIRRKIKQQYLVMKQHKAVYNEVHIFTEKQLPKRISPKKYYKKIHKVPVTASSLNMVTCNNYSAYVHFLEKYEKCLVFFCQPRLGNICQDILDFTWLLTG